jgi:tight adherence protein B
VNPSSGIGRPLVTGVLITLFALLVLPASAQPVADIQLRDARLQADGSTRLLVSISGLEGRTLDAGAFRVLEDGQDVGGVEVEPLTELDDAPVVVALPFDVSGSVTPVFDEIQQAGRGFVEEVTAAGFEVALIPFSGDVEVAVPPTADTATVIAGIDALQTSVGTSLYDAIVTSGDVLEERLAHHEAGVGIIVVFSDGADHDSTATLEEAIGAAQRVNAPITTVGWETRTFDLPAMTRMAEETGGEVVSSEDADEVASLFRSVAADLTNQYLVRYRSDVLAPAELPVTVIVDTPEGELRVDSLAINTREQTQLAPPTPEPSVLAGPRFSFLATSAGLWVGVGAAFLAILTLLWVLLVQTRRTAGSRTLERGLRALGRGPRPKSGEIELPTSRLTERAIDLVGRVPKPEGFDQRLQLQLDRAAWPVRTNEFLLLCVASGLLGGLLGVWATNLFVGLVLAVIAGAMPVLIMKIRIERRRRAFMEQLPGTLQLLAGSLRAGYGLLQALDTVVKEADDPTAPEFARVLTETRLGMPVEEALEGMAQRLDSGDFHWVVLAIGIQREVGGNLAELLTTVAATMRGRATLRRQIRVLSAEGRISAWVIAAMPFVVAMALSVMNPGYLAELFIRLEGLVMLGVGALLLVVGAFWLKKIVSIEV